MEHTVSREEVDRQRVLVELSHLALAGVDAAELDARAAELIEQFERSSDAVAGDCSLREQAQEICSAARRRSESENALRQSEARLAEAQRIGRMGSYDWEIDENRNTWSDELYRIYGVEPQSFNVTYERFMSFVHPDDREAVAAVHAHVLRTGEPYQVEERIIRADGEVRLLRTWGEVVCDPAGRPVRIRGICQDVTDQRRAEEELGRSAARFETLFQSTPDAVIVVDPDGVVVQANAQTVAVLGYEADELVGQHVDLLVPERLRPAHRRHRARFMTSPRARSMGADLDLFALRKDGSEVPVEVALAVLGTEDAHSVAVFIRDITERRRAEHLALELHDAVERRRHALEINDNVVQGLVACQYLLEGGRTAPAAQALRTTLGAAKLMMNDLLGTEAEASLGPGALVRAKPAPALLDHSVADGNGSSPPAAVRVLLADDAADLRTTFRLALESSGRFAVVGEAGDGAEAVAMAASLRPDVVVMDLAMPVMDGLEAIGLVRRGVPEARIVAVSGFDSSRLRPLSMAAGAHAYVEKGKGLDDLTACIDALLGNAPTSAPHEEAEIPVETLMHELRTPLTVVEGVVRILRARLDALSREKVDELFAALERSAWHLRGVVEAYTGSSFSLFEVSPTTCDLGHLARDLAAEMGLVSNGHTVRIACGDGVTAWADPVRVRQVLSNLLTNAVRHTPNGTVVSVTARRSADVVELVCEDDGPGIPLGDRDALFSRGAALGPHSGSGIGLHLSRRLAEAMGGALDFEVPDSGGSRFVLRLPAATVEPVPAPAPPRGRRLWRGRRARRNNRAVTKSAARR